MPVFEITPEAKSSFSHSAERVVLVSMKLDWRKNPAFPTAHLLFFWRHVGLTHCFPSISSQEQENSANTSQMQAKKLTKPNTNANAIEAHSAASLCAKILIEAQSPKPRLLLCANFSYGAPGGSVQDFFSREASLTHQRDTFGQDAF